MQEVGQDFLFCSKLKVQELFPEYKPGCESPCHTKVVCTYCISVHAFRTEALLHLKQFSLLSLVKYGRTGEMQGQMVKVIGQEGMALN